MAVIRFAQGTADDLDRLVRHLVSFHAESIDERIESLIDALDVLAHSPLIGRPAGDGRRELVVGRGSSGYLALYRFLPELDTVLVLALRHQREAGYRDDF